MLTITQLWFLVSSLLLMQRTNDSTKITSMQQSKIKCTRANAFPWQFFLVLFFLFVLYYLIHIRFVRAIFCSEIYQTEKREKKKISQINEWNGKRNYSNWNWIRQYVRPQLNSLFCARRFFFCHFFFISKLLNCLQQLRYHYPICVQSKCKHTHLFTWTENKRKQTIHQFHCID